jgi:hypothetical protein
LPIAIGVAHVEKKGTLLEDGEVHDATCESNSNLIFKMKEPHYSSRNFLKFVRTFGLILDPFLYILRFLVLQKKIQGKSNSKLYIILPIYT